MDKQPVQQLQDHLQHLDQLTVHISNDAMHSDLDGETVILETTRGEYYSVDNVGSRIWELLKEERSIPDIMRTLLAEFAVDEERCRTEVIQFLQELLDNNLISCQRQAS